ncbi:AAA family ATPase [Candidatus Saccharibacteria bacterium]|nr:AAA family ATPase [Candidatus Saccharibacteria bacterium]
MKHLKIIGIAGTNGSGKDTVGEILASDHGWLFVSVSEDLLAPELERQNLPVDRQHLAALSTQWRREFGMGATVDKAFEKFEAERGLHKLGGLAIASLRHPGEVDRLHQLGGVVIWVDAKPEVRYERIYKRGQGAKDQKTLEEFLAEQEAEMQHSGDKATLNIAGVKAKADIFIDNNGSLEDFKRSVETALKI